MSTATERIRVDEILVRAEEGTPRPDSKDYLWDGEVVEVMTQSVSHDMAVLRLARRLGVLYPEDAWNVRYELVLILIPDVHEPKPDVMVLKGSLDAYDRHPRPADVEILIEVANTTLREDMTDKLHAYAAAGIPRYWVASVEGLAILTFEDPDPATGLYRESRVYTRGQVAPTPLGDVRVDDIFGRRTGG